MFAFMKNSGSKLFLSPKFSVSKIDICHEIQEFDSTDTILKSNKNNAPDFTGDFRVAHTQIHFILGDDMSAKTVSEEAAHTVSPRQWIRLVVVYLLIPLILFICGGDLGWWQAWLYSILILAAGIGGRMWAEQRHPGLTAERQNIEKIKTAKAWDKVLAPLMAVSLVFPMVIVAGLDHRFNWSPEFPLWLSVVGFLFIAFGYSFAAWAFVENRFFSSVVRIQTDRGHVVCDTGPYRFVRHPGYAGSIVPLFGIVLALGSVWSMIPAAVATIIAVIRIVLEDQTLQEELPGYRDYTQRVRYRLIPGIY
ncbi:methyltransferase family protein [Desulfobacula sp.]|uniref:methyltransferase family protein n=1 Tax=Desulfobacula sp. TaxID=2593537 RepID=UPI0039B9C053